MMSNVTMQKPTNEDTNSKQKKHKQRARHLSRPEQELYLYDSYILDDKKNSKSGKD